MGEEAEFWYVLLIHQPETRAGFIEGTSLRVRHTPMGWASWALVRDDGQGPVEAARFAREGLEPDERALVSTAKVGRLVEMQEVAL